MTILSSADHAERERESPSTGEDAFNRELVAARYTGSRSVYQNQSVRNHGGWPGKHPFQHDEWYVARVPERHLGWWEGHADFEIAYDPETIARAFLDDNYLPPEVFSVNANRDLREAVFGHLDLEGARDNDGYREQLREIAGVSADEDDGGAGDPDDRDPRVAEIEDNYERSDYKRAVEAIREDDGVDQSLNASNEDLVQFLAADERDDDRVTRLLENRGDSGGGGDE